MLAQWIASTSHRVFLTAFETRGQKIWNYSGSMMGLKRKPTLNTITQRRKHQRSEGSESSNSIAWKPTGGHREPGKPHSYDTWSAMSEEKTGTYVNFNRKQATVSEKCALGIIVIYPGNEQVASSLACSQCYVVVDGTAVINTGKGILGKSLNRLDALWVPAGTLHSIKNAGHELLWIFWSHERPQRVDSIAYKTN